MQKLKTKELSFVLILCFWDDKWQWAGFSAGVSDHQPFDAVNYFLYSYILKLTRLRYKSSEGCMVKTVVKDLPIISNIIGNPGLSYPFLVTFPDKGRVMYSSFTCR